MSKIDNPASAIPALERPEIASGPVPPADGGIAARIVQHHARIPVSMSAMVPDAVRIVREQIERDANSPAALADSRITAEIVEACRKGFNVFDPTGQIARDNPGSK